VQLCPHVDPEPTPVLRCWERDASVPAVQRLRSVALYQAIICAACEPWVRTALHSSCLKPVPEDALP
jgi:hypothetical protein